jgi:DNA-directed RNA polymerase specialized sigma subunit
MNLAKQEKLIRNRDKKLRARLEMIDRYIRVVACRKRGMNFREIGEQEGISATRVQQLLTQASRRVQAWSEL